MLRQQPAQRLPWSFDSRFVFARNRSYDYVYVYDHDYDYDNYGCDTFYDRPLWDLFPRLMSGSGPNGGARVLLSHVPCSCTVMYVGDVTRMCMNR